MPPLMLIEVTTPLVKKAVAVAGTKPEPEPPPLSVTTGGLK